MFRLTKHRYNLDRTFTAISGDSEDNTIYRIACSNCKKICIDKKENLKTYIIIVKKGGIFVRLMQNSTANYFDIGFERYGKVVMYKITSNLPHLIPHSTLDRLFGEVFWNLHDKKPVTRDLLLMNIYAFEHYYKAHNLPELLSGFMLEDPL